MQRRRAPLTLVDLLAPARGTALATELDAIRCTFAGRKPRVYLVGGLVRDLLLGRSSRDIDLAVAGPLGDLAERLAEVLGGEPRHHRPFMTASFESRQGFTIDLARLRRESYREPAALPEVSAGSLAEDLFRRDFTVNAMAVDLARESSRLIDFHDGFEDLAAGRLRVLHPDSFRDDPTRILRGIRLAYEIEFEFEEATRRLAAEAEAQAAFERVSGFRLWRELRACFRSPGAARRTLTELEVLGLLSAIHPGLAGGEIAARDEELVDPVAVLRVWTRDLDRHERWDLAERLALSRHERLAIGVRPPGREARGPAR